MANGHLAPNAPSHEIAAFLRSSGYAIVDDAADAALMDRLAGEVAPYVDASTPGRDIYDGQHTRRTGALIARCAAARELVMHPVVTGVVGDFLSHATTHQLHLTQLITIEPAETKQKPHRDQMAFDLFPFTAGYHVQCNAMWALTNFTAENGATHLAPGTSTMDDTAAEQIAEIQATMRCGSVLFYDGKVLHGGGANTSDRPRQGVNITYAVGWVRQEENQYLACPPEIARSLDDDLLKMMGYQQGAFALGYVGDRTDPLAALRGSSEKVKTVENFRESNDSFETFVDDLDR